MKALKICAAVLRGVLVALCVALCAYNIYVLVQRYAFGNQMPTVFGFAGAEVVTGSMDDDSGDDDIEVGDFVITRARSEYSVGDVVTFYHAQDDIYITHRVVAVNGATYTIRGDYPANSAADIVPLENIVGKVVLVIGGAGGVLEFFRSPAGLLVVIAAGVLIWLISDIISDLIDRRKEKDEESED